MTYTIRPARRDDGPFLADMLVEAMNWNWTKTRARVDVLADEQSRRHVAGWPRPGDIGSVAESPDGDRVGACWFRLLTAPEPGHGFVATGVPELTLGVKPLWRAQGVGRALLQAVLGQAAAAGYARISLSVHHDNFASRLYRSEGFQTISREADADTMVRNLR
ncbi:GNAT family N-acetyltransferase [Microbacteriaceae bacterium VKM Ac-2855]|nr:GNAT family N-acetyltransferase [Microbacteriaceae bacterium VKM Ac-2855]